MRCFRPVSTFPNQNSILAIKIKWIGEKSGGKTKTKTKPGNIWKDQKTRQEKKTSLFRRITFGGNIVIFFIFKIPVDSFGVDEGEYQRIPVAKRNGCKPSHAVGFDWMPWCFTVSVLFMRKLLLFWIEAKILIIS